MLIVGVIVTLFALFALAHTNTHICIDTQTHTHGQMIVRTVNVIIYIYIYPRAHTHIHTNTVLVSNPKVLLCIYACVYAYLYVCIYVCVCMLWITKHYNSMLIPNRDWVHICICVTISVCLYIQSTHHIHPHTTCMHAFLRRYTHTSNICTHVYAYLHKNAEKWKEN